jgi:hypothetical protein
MATTAAALPLYLGIHLSEPASFARTYREVLNEDAAEDETERFRREFQDVVRAGDIVIDNPKAEAFELMHSTATRSPQRSATFTRSSSRAKVPSSLPPTAPWRCTIRLPRRHGQVTRGGVRPTRRRTLPRPPSLSGRRSRAARGHHHGGSDDKLVREINLRTYGWAKRFIYGSSQEVVAQVRREVKRFPQLVVRPRKSMHSSARTPTRTIRT